MSYSQYGKVRAIFEPKRMDDLKSAAKQFIGREATFEVLWKIPDGLGSEYAGQYAMGVPREWADEAAESGYHKLEDMFAWVPEQDVRVLAVLDIGLNQFD